MKQDFPITLRADLRSVQTVLYALRFSSSRALPVLARQQKPDKGDKKGF